MANQFKVRVQDDEARVSTLPQSLSDDYRKKQGELIDLTELQKRRLKKFLKDSIRDWLADTSDLHRRLEDDNDLVEGVVDETDFPWEGASNLHVPVTEIYMELYKSVFKRSILGADVIWYATTDDDSLRDATAEIDDMMNYLATNEWNIKKALENVLWTTPRDGLGIMQITWCEEYEPTNDIVLIVSAEEFLKEFPSPEESGLKEDEWFELADYVDQNASEEFPVEIPIKFERRTYYGNKADVVELIDFITIPATVKDIKDESCRGYGKRFSNRSSTLKKKAKDGTYYQDAVTKLTKKRSNESSITSFRRSQDDIEGLSRTNTSDNYELFEIVIKGSLDGDTGEEDKYIVTYSYESDELLQCVQYFYRRDFYALFRINERPNRLIGRSVPQKTRDFNDEVDTQHNQRINTRTISTVPSFKALESKKKDMDPMLRQNKWKPGVIFWLTDFESFEQFKVQPTDLGESLSEEKNSFQILDLYLGSAASLLSGGTSPTDPSAPGNKTAMMIQQSNLRMDDPLSELREGINEVGDICLSHLYQFGPPIIEYMTEGQTPNGPVKLTKTIHKKYLRRGIKMNMRGVTVTQNPDFEMAKTWQLYAQLMQEPVFQQSPQLRLEVLRDALKAGRVSGRDRYLPSLEQIQAQQVETQKQAMMQMQQEQAMAQQQAAQDALKQRLGAAKQELDIKRTAENMAKMNMGEPMPQSMGTAQ